MSPFYLVFPRRNAHVDITSTFHAGGVCLCSITVGTSSRPFNFLFFTFEGNERTRVSQGEGEKKAVVMAGGCEFTTNDQMRLRLEIVDGNREEEA